MDYSVNARSILPPAAPRAQGGCGLPLRAQLSMALPLDCQGRGMLLPQGLPRHGPGTLTR